MSTKKWYEIIIEHDNGGTEGIYSFETKKEAKAVANAFKRFVDSMLYVEEEVGERGS